jgi:hypothetical protein
MVKIVVEWLLSKHSGGGMAISFAPGGDGAQGVKKRS